MKKIFLVFLFLFCFMLSYGFYDWNTIKNDRFTIFHKQEYEKKALLILSALDYYSKIAEDIVGGDVSSLPVVLDDCGTYVNGYANPVYYNIHLLNYDSGDADWLSLGIIHEYTHILHLTRAEGMPKIFTTFFGDIFSPQIFSPLWIYEGITVYNESKISHFMGRLNDGGFDSYIGTCVYENKFPSILKATYTPLEAPFGNGFYLFGSEFFNFLAAKYGEDKFKKFFDSYSGSLMSYLSPLFPWLGVDRTFDEVFGKTTMALWDEWENYEKEKQKNYKQPGQKITNYGGYVSYPLVKLDKLYFVRTVIDKNGPFSVKTRYDIIEMDLNTQEQKIYLSTTSNINHPLRFDGINMYYSIDEIRTGYANKSNKTFGQYLVLYEKNILTGNEREVLSGGIKTYCINYGKLIYAKDKIYSFGSEIFEYDIETKEEKFIMDTDYHVMLFDSDGENIVCVAKKQGENTGIYLFDIDKKTLKLLLNTPYIEGDAKIYDNKIFFQSNYEKIYSIYYYDLKTNKIFRLTDNGFAGAPAYDTKTEKLYFVGLNTDGFDIYKIKSESKEFKFKDFKTGKIQYPVLKEGEFKYGNYLDNLITLLPRIRMPLFLYDTDKNMYSGVYLSGSDAIGDFNLTGQILYKLNNSVTYQDFLFKTYIFAPVAVKFLYTNNNDQRDDRIGIGINYLLYTGYKPGISGVSLDINYLIFDNFTWNRISQGINIGFNYPFVNSGLAAYAVFENDIQKVNFKSHEGYYGNFYITYFLPETKMSVFISGFYGLNEKVDNSTYIRGYKDAIYSDKAISGAIEISRNLIKIRQGLWNPVNIYFEDLSGIVFFDSCATKYAFSYSYGIELHLETKFAFFATNDIGLRFAMNKNKDFYYNIIFKIPYLQF